MPVAGSEDRQLVVEWEDERNGDQGGGSQKAVEGGWDENHVFEEVLQSWKWVSADVMNFYYELLV